MNARMIEKEALDLPVDKRAKLAERLLESLDELTEAEIDEGKAQVVTSEELERRVRALLK